jgi:hypothetical protein
MATGPLWFLLAVAVGVLAGLIFQKPLLRLWNHLTREFRQEQKLQRFAQTSEHGHFYLTIAKYDREMPPIDCYREKDGTRTYVWDGKEFANEDAANFARRHAVLAAARAFYGDIDMWQKSLPPPPRPRFRDR